MVKELTAGITGQVLLNRSRANMTSTSTSSYAAKPESDLVMTQAAKRLRNLEERRPLNRSSILKKAGANLLSTSAILAASASTFAVGITTAKHADHLSNRAVDAFQHSQKAKWNGHHKVARLDHQIYKLENNDSNNDGNEVVALFFGGILIGSFGLARGVDKFIYPRV